MEAMSQWLWRKTQKKQGFEVGGKAYHHNSVHRQDQDSREKDNARCYMKYRSHQPNQGSSMTVMFTEMIPHNVYGYRFATAKPHDSLVRKSINLSQIPLINPPIFSLFSRISWLCFLSTLMSCYTSRTSNLSARIFKPYVTSLQFRTRVLVSHGNGVNIIHEIMHGVI